MLQSRILSRKPIQLQSSTHLKPQQTNRIHPRQSTQKVSSILTPSVYETPPERKLIDLPDPIFKWVSPSCWRVANIHNHIFSKGAHPKKYHPSASYSSFCVHNVGFFLFFPPQTFLLFALQIVRLPSIYPGFYIVWRRGIC